MHVISSEALANEGGSLSAKALWLASAKALAFAFNVALPLVLVRQLTVSDFGLYKQAFLIVNTAVMMLPLGFAMSAFYFWPRETKSRDSIVFNILLFYAFICGVAGLVLTFRPETLAEILQGPELVAHGGMIGLVIFLFGASSFLEIVAIASGETRLAGILIVSLQLTKTVLLLAATLWSPSVGALLSAATVYGIVQITILLAYLGSRFGRFWRRFDGALLRAQLGYALPHGLAAWLSWIHLDLHNYFVAHRFDAAAYAVYAVGCFQLPLLGILNESVGSVVIPRVSELRKDGRAREVVAVAAGFMRKLAAVYFPLYAFLLVVHREFITVLFTEQYLASAPIFAVHLTLVPLSIIAAPGDAVIRAYARHRFFYVKLRLVLTGLTVTGLWLATTRFGLVGAIGVVVAVMLIERIALAVKVSAILALGRRDLAPFGDLAKLALASAVAGLAIVMVRNLLLDAGPMAVLLGCAVVFGATYLGVVLFSGVATTAERDAVLGGVGRLYGRLGKKSANGVA